MNDDGHLIQLYPAWRQALRRFMDAGFAPDALLSYDWLYEAFDLVKPTPETPLAEAEKVQLAFLAQFKLFEKALLTEHQIHLDNVRSLGYRIVPPAEQTAVAQAKARANFKREVRRLGASLENVDLARLSSAARRENADTLARASMLAGMMNQAGFLELHRRPAQKTLSAAAEGDDDD